MGEEEYLKKYLKEEDLEQGLERLHRGEPAQYIVGNVDFYGYLLDVNPSVLIPRFETEELVSKTIAHLREFEHPRIADIGTGSGCIAIALKKEIDCVRVSVLPNPQRTIGVLIRGTDYTISHIPGHSRMASPEQVYEKIKEFECSGNYDAIFLSTEDEDVLQTMKRLCGDRLHYIDQKRFRIRPGERLADQEKERENEGWLKGKEYLTTLQLLSECAAFIASGGCCGTTCVMNTGGEHFKETYVFDLGTY